MEREVRHMVANSEPKAIIAADSDVPYPAGVDLWDVDDLAVDAARHAPGAARFIDGDAPAAIIYTSGTTGTAKGAVLSHNNLAANGIHCATCWRITEADRYLAVLP